MRRGWAYIALNRLISPMQSRLAQLGIPLVLALAFPSCLMRADSWQRLPATGLQAGPPWATSTDPDLLSDPPPFLSEPSDPDSIDGDSVRPNFAELMRPTVTVAAEWQAEASDVDVMWYRATVQMPTYPFLGPPPPMINGGFAYTSLSAPEAWDLPADLYDYSLGASWMRPISERWMLRLMASVALATDGQNTSSDAWQFRGGLFGTYRPNDQWTWILGVLALGRNDLPVVPAVGAIWQPLPPLRFDLTFPRPRASWLLLDNGPRQQWGYLGGGLEGGTWGFERAGGVDDQLTYRDWRVVLGWESVPTPEPGMPFSRGRKLGVEVGYVFAREFEFSGGAPSLEIDNTLLLRASAGF
ncbi:MAG: DUF6268 family outer membrane beta-barrel protein [Pirellulaceae bacterium]